MTKRAAIYARVSTDEQAERGYSLPQQIEDCQRCAHGYGFEVVGEFRDDFTGTVPMAARPEGQRLEALIGVRGVDAVICYNAKRLGRGMVDALVTARDWLRAGIELYLVDGGQVRSEKDIRFIIDAWDAERDRDDTIKRLRRGRFGKAKSGKVVLHGDRPPYGYRVTDDDRLAVHEPEAKIVQMVFDLYVNGNGTGERMSMPKVARHLTKLGVPTWVDVHGPLGAKQRQRGEWSTAAIAKMLHSETYKGSWHYGKTRTGTDYLNPRETWVEVSVPAIVSEERWEAAQKCAKRNRRTAKRNVKHDYLMRYRLACSCGYRISCNAKQRKLADGTIRLYCYYSCTGVRKANIRSCSMPSFRAERADALIWDWVEGWLLKPKQLAQEIRERQRQRGRELEPMRERLATVEELIADNEAQLERLLDLYLVGDFTKELLTQRHEQLKATLEGLKDEQAKLTAGLEAQTFTEEQIMSITELGAQLATRLEDESKATFERKRWIIERMDVQGTMAVEDGEKVIHVRATLGGLKGRLCLSDASTTTRI